MDTEKTFLQQIDALQQEVRQLDDDFYDTVVEETATRLQGLNFSPPVITPMESFLTMRRQGLLAEIDRILAMPEMNRVFTELAARLREWVPVESVQKEELDA